MTPEKQELTQEEQDALNIRLFQAATEDRSDIVADLLAEGAQLNAVRDSNGYTALIYAAAHGCTATVRMLLDEGADIEPVTYKTGLTAVTIAERHRDKTIKVLEKVNDDVEPKEYDDIQEMKEEIKSYNEIIEMIQIEAQKRQEAASQITKDDLVGTVERDAYDLTVVSVGNVSVKIKTSVTSDDATEIIRAIIPAIRNIEIPKTELLRT